MTTKIYLSQIEKISLMIDAKVEERYELLCLATKITTSTEGERVKSSPDPDKMTNIVEKIMKCEDEISENIGKLLEKKKKIVEQIDEIENPELYNVLTLKYVQLMSDEEAMDNIHRSATHYYRLLRSALNEFETKFGNTYLNDGEKSQISSKW